MAEPVLLISGFGPFSTHARNPSGELALELDAERMSGMSLRGVLLDVSWSRAFAQLEQAVTATPPIALLCLGVAQTDFLRIELRANNIALPDELDVDRAPPTLASDFRVIETGELAYETTLPAAHLEARLRERRDRGEPLFPVRRWHHAGSYLCNYVFLMAQHHLRDRIPHSGFVHVPPYAEGRDFDSSRDQLRATVRALVHELVLWLERPGPERRA